MTLGEHIQTLRKEKGYSQEALGEALGVTRQSISKWESDGAIPEVEKLIAMSKLFGVPVGVLLQVEEPAGEELPHELTERELQAVEAIVAKYLAESQKLRPTPKKKKWPRVLLSASALVFVLWAVVQISGLVTQLHSLQNTVGAVRSDVTQQMGQMNSLTGQIEDILERQNSVTAGESHDIQAIDLKSGTVTFTLSATPKQYVEGMTAAFSAQPADGAVVSTEGKMDPVTKTFSAELTCPISDAITLSVAFQKGDEVQTRILDTQEWLETQTRPFLSCNSFIIMDEIAAGVDYHWTDSITFRTDREMFQTASEVVIIEAEKIRFRVYLNGEEVWRSNILNVTLPTGDGSDWQKVPMDLTLPLTEGDKILIVAEVTDNQGRTYFEVGEAYTVEDWEISYVDHPADLSWIES